MEGAEILQEVKDLYYNKKWVDCTKDNPEWVSTNNGVFLCLSCCAKHRSLGHSSNNVSKIKSIMHLDWEYEELMALQKGGNRAFIEFMSTYDLNDCPPHKKYNSNACSYYRRMLEGYIIGQPINELPPTLNAGVKLWNNSSGLKEIDESDVSPIRRNDSSIDLSRSEFSCKDKPYDNKWNSSMILNKSWNVSRYSINIEAQNDLGKITILLNEKEEGKELRNHISDFRSIGLDDNFEINDDDLSSDKDKYSRWYESSRKHINFQELPDVRQTRSRFMDGDFLDCTIEGNRSIPTWCTSFDGFDGSREQSMEILSHATKAIADKGLDVSKNLYSKTKQGITKIMRSEAVATIKQKFWQFLSTDDERLETRPNTYPTFTEDQTACTIAKGRRQSINYNNKKINPFYYEE